MKGKGTSYAEPQGQDSAPGVTSVSAVRDSSQLVKGYQSAGCGISVTTLGVVSQTSERGSSDWAAKPGQKPAG